MYSVLIKGTEWEGGGRGAAPESRELGNNQKTSFYSSISFTTTKGLYIFIEWKMNAMKNWEWSERVNPNWVFDCREEEKGKESVERRMKRDDDELMMMEGGEGRKSEEDCLSVLLTHCARKVGTFFKSKK